MLKRFGKGNKDRKAKLDIYLNSLLLPMHEEDEAKNGRRERPLDALLAWTGSQSFLEHRNIAGPARAGHAREHPHQRVHRHRQGPRVPRRRRLGAPSVEAQWRRRRSPNTWSWQ